MEEQIKWLIHQFTAFLKKKLEYNSEDLPYYLSIIISFIFFIIGLNVFLEIAEGLVNNNLYTFDNIVSQYIISYRTEELSTIFRFITDLGDFAAYVIFSVLLTIILIVNKEKGIFIFQIIVVSVLSFYINLFLKEFYDRARPDAEQLVKVSHLSFPSGHAMSAAAYYGFLIYLSVRYFKYFWLKVAVTIFCIILILGIGISRVYLGVHYPSDVVAGFLGGVLWMTFCVVIFNIIGLIRKRKLRNHA